MQQRDDAAKSRPSTRETATAVLTAAELKDRQALLAHAVAHAALGATEHKKGSSRTDWSWYIHFKKALLRSEVKGLRLMFLSASVAK